MTAGDSLCLAGKPMYVASAQSGIVIGLQEFSRVSDRDVSISVIIIGPRRRGDRALHRHVADRWGTSRLLATSAADAKSFEHHHRHDTTPFFGTGDERNDRQNGKNNGEPRKAARRRLTLIKVHTNENTMGVKRVRSYRERLPRSTMLGHTGRMTQAEALPILKTGVNVFLTGEPGSGKPHIVNAYVQYLRER